MKRIIIMAFGLLCMLAGCTLMPAETKSEYDTQIQLSVDETEENVQQKETDFSKGDLRTMFEEINNEEIEDFLYGDYNKDGQHEAFVLTKQEDNHNLWFFHPKECVIVRENIKGIQPLETDILMYSTKDYVLLQQLTEDKRNTMVYSVDNDDRVFEADISNRGYVSLTAKDEIWLQSEQTKQVNTNQGEINTYYLYYVFDEGFREYGAIPIGIEQFLEFEGAQEILDEVSTEYPDCEIEYSFLYRTNHYINVNITLNNDGNIEYKNMTLTYNDYEVMRVSDKLAEGKIEIAHILDIATFPITFKHPRNDRNTQESGG